MGWPIEHRGYDFVDFVEEVTEAERTKNVSLFPLKKELQKLIKSRVAIAKELGRVKKREKNR